MKLLALVLAALALAAWALERWMLHRGRARRAVDRSNLRHITGAKPWWKETPRNPPEGDH